MPRKPITISLRKSLSSSKVGFLRLGTPLLQVAEELGPPKGWITNAYSEPVPLYWFYPGGLELSFEPEPPYPLQAFKLSSVGMQNSRTTKFNDFLRMHNDFPMIETSVSGFLQSGLWDLKKVRVGICTDPLFPTLDIFVGCLRIPFLMFSETQKELGYRLSGTGNDLGRKAALLDQNCHFHGAYFSHDDLSYQRFPTEGWTTIGADEYLRMLDSSI